MGFLAKADWWMDLENLRDWVWHENQIGSAWRKVRRWPQPTMLLEEAKCHESCRRLAGSHHSNHSESGIIGAVLMESNGKRLKLYKIVGQGFWFFGIFSMFACFMICSHYFNINDIMIYTASNYDIDVSTVNTFRNWLEVQVIRVFECRIMFFKSLKLNARDYGNWSRLAQVRNKDSRS